MLWSLWARRARSLWAGDLRRGPFVGGPAASLGNAVHPQNTHSSSFLLPPGCSATSWRRTRCSSGSARRSSPTTQQHSCCFRAQRRARRWHATAARRGGTCTGASQAPLTRRSRGSSRTQQQAEQTRRRWRRSREAGSELPRQGTVLLYFLSDLDLLLSVLDEKMSNQTHTCALDN